MGKKIENKTENKLTVVGVNDLNFIVNYLLCLNPQTPEIKRLVEYINKNLLHKKI